MGLYASFDVIDDFGYLDFTEEYGISPDYSEGCDVFVETFLRVARSYVPVDTGYLRSTLKASTDGTFCECETKCEYAEYVEYGTWCCPDQPYFEPALSAAISAASWLWSQAEEDALLEEEMLLAEEEEEEEEQGGSGGRGGSGGFGFGSFVGSILAFFVMSIILVSIQNFFELISPGSSSSGGGRGGGGGGGGGAPYLPDVIIT